MNKEHFDTKFIDEIIADPANNYFSGVLEYSINYCSPNTMCDVGCGNGVFTGALKDHYDIDLIGIDGSNHALEKASSLNFDHLYFVNDLSNDELPVDSDSIDLVICKDVMEHLISPLHLSKEIFRITKPGGSSLIHVPNHFTVWGRLKFLFTNNIDTFSYFVNSPRYKYPHIRFFNINSLEEMIKLSGFTKIENISYFFTKVPFFHRFLPSSFSNYLSKLSTDNFSEGITILAKKPSSYV